MPDKKITLSLDQLNDIVRTAVIDALKRIEGIEISEEKDQPQIGEFSEEQYREAMETMARNRHKGTTL